MRWLSLALMLIISVIVLVIACDKNDILRSDGETGEDNYEMGPLLCLAPPPSPLINVNAFGQELTLWPYIGQNLVDGPHDPVNLIFVGQADPRNLRAALIALDGNRTAFGFPDEFPFNCTWHDCMGDIQAAYGLPAGWTGNAIQLDCGDYQQVRFHLRFFRAGDWTIGNCHFEFLIPGTTEHQVLSWELAEQLVLADFMRSGLLDPTAPVGSAPGANDSPWREIPPYIYNELPQVLRGLIGGPPEDVDYPVPIWSDGNATILNVAQAVDWIPFRERQNLTLNLGQVIPKPFCTGEGYEYVYVEGPVNLTQVSSLIRPGRYSSVFNASGWIDVTPVDPGTDPPTPLGDTYRARIRQMQYTRLNDRNSVVNSFIYQHEIPDSGPYRGYLVSEMRIGPGSYNHYSINIQCEP